MIPARSGADVLGIRQKEAIHRNVLCILSEFSLQVEHG